jgi:RNA polymerase sigma factor (sigma-70 family)
MDEPTRILVARAQGHDGQAAGALFERYRGRLRAALGRMLAGSALGAEADRDDLVQDAILSALRGIDRFEYRGQGSFLAWLLQTARNELLQRLRARGTRKRDGGARSLESVSEPRAAQATPSQIAAGHELEQRIQDCLERLPEHERTVLVLRRYLDAETQEIQEELDLPSAGAVRALLSRAQARLAQLLDAPDGAA